MSDTNDAFARSVALEKALQFHKIESIDPSDTDVLATAEKFRAFLAGETPEAPTSEPELPVFVIPRLWDGYTYFQFESSPILYRSDTRVGSAAPGYVWRIHSGIDKEWADQVVERLGTRDALRAADGYDEIGAVGAPNVIQQNMKGVRFE